MFHQTKGGPTKTSFLGSLPLCVASFALMAAHARSALIDYRLAALPVPSTSDQAASVPTSQGAFAIGSTLFLEVWVQTTEVNGVSSASVDATFIPSLLTAVNVAHTATFSALTHHVIDDAGGRIDDLSGSHLGPCSDAIAVTPNWRRAAVVEFVVDASGPLTIQSAPTGSPVYGTAICGIGDIDPAQISYGSVMVQLGDGAIPAVSEWGVAVLVLLLLIAATLLIRGLQPNMLLSKPTP